ncbi:MAG: reverse transcriptase domain-containing protein [Paludibacteraceae bacterium]|nr:reverse transcriptase domain-containing protein [Paludibacteraceae bacterium]
MDLPEWFNIKKYPHIGIRPSKKDYNWMIDYITNPDKIIHHPFLPLIRRSVWVHRTKIDSCTGKKKWKERKLTYASHFDAQIYSYYAFMLQSKYDDMIKKEGLNEVAIAYRKIPTEENKNANKCNIHFAYDTFNFVKDKLEIGNDLAFITFDITGFFDNLDHKKLKSSWAKVLEKKNLPDDVYAVYKNVTKFSFVKEGPLFSLFKNKILCECKYKTKKHKKKKGRIKKRKISSRRFLREHDVIAFCKKSDLKTIRQHNLIERDLDSDHKGIPQGLPISAVLANVYMLDFDITVNQEIVEVGGLYKRYSDDIVVVCPYSSKDEVIKLILDEIEKVKLEIEKSKTNTFKISKDTDGNISCIYEPNEGELLKHKEIEYLGFSFDGKRILIKKAGLCKYYTKMRKDIGRHGHWAINIKNKTKGNVFVNQIVRRFTLAGSSSFKKEDEKGNIIIKHGNFLTYIKKASKIMNEPAIFAQMSKNLNKVNTAIANLEKRVTTKKRRKIAKKTIF